MRAHLDQVSAKLAANDSDERLVALGVLVLKGAAHFQNRRQIAVGESVVKARRFVVATGSLPALPDIPGLAELPVVTEDSLFELVKCPERLIVLGGTAAAVELAQAMRALGSEVALIARDGLLLDEDPEAVGVLRRALLGDGIALHEGRPILRAESHRQRPRLVLDGEIRVDGTHLFVANGRRPNIAGLELDLAGVRSDEAGNRRRRLAADRQSQHLRHRRLRRGRGRRNDVPARLRSIRPAGATQRPVPPADPLQA